MINPHLSLAQILSMKLGFFGIQFSRTQAAAPAPTGSAL